ncbi:MAG: hypothetical protein ACREA0_08705, partial [bacterium]
PVRQWVLSLPKRLRYFLHHDPALIGPVLRIFLKAAEDRLKAQSPGAPAEARFGAVTFVYRFGTDTVDGRHRPFTPGSGRAIMYWDQYL